MQSMEMTVGKVLQYGVGSTATTHATAESEMGGVSGVYASATGDRRRATVPEFLRWTPKSRHGPLSPFYLL